MHINEVHGGRLVTSISRRKVIAIAGLGLAGILGATGARELLARPIGQNLAGVLVKRWGCQYQNVDLDQVAASDLDLIVLDPSLDGRPLSLRASSRVFRKASGGRRLVLAYLSIGEAASHRDYWRSSWSHTPPPWLGPENTRWSGSYLVRYWDREWRDLLLTALDQIQTAGFDGVFLDRVDAFVDWQAPRSQARRDMIDLVRQLSYVAKSRRNDFIVMAQNAEPLLADASYCEAIHAVSKESLLYNLHGVGVPNPENDVQWSLPYLKEAQSRGLPIFAIEYLDDPASQRRARRELNKLGFVPFFGRRLLDTLPT